MEDIPEEARRLITEFNSQQSKNSDPNNSEKKKRKLQKAIESVVEGGKLLTPREAFELAKLMGFEVQHRKEHAMIIGPNGEQLAIPRRPVQEKTLAKGIQMELLKTLGLKGNNK